MAEENGILSILNSNSLTGEITVPGDKSISHRAIMLGSLAKGITEIKGFLRGEDALATVSAFRKMGIKINEYEEGLIEIHGQGLYGLNKSKTPIDLGNSGTSMRLLAGILTGQKFDSELVGDKSLSRRPMRRIALPLEKLGGVIKTSAQGTPPLFIAGNKSLKGTKIELKIASAQIKSSLLLAGLYADGSVQITEPMKTRDHTERMLKAFGYDIEQRGNTVKIKGGGLLKNCFLNIPGDISSAAFFIVAASIIPGSDLVLKNIGINPTRIGIIKILKLMGASIKILHQREISGELVADIRVKSALLKGIRVPISLVPISIDEFPVLFVAAACASGTTVVEGAEELRVKESDRIQSMVSGLGKIGVTIEDTPDGAIILGGGQDFFFSGGEVEAADDHRVAMALAIAGLRCENPLQINGCQNIATSFPGFVSLGRSIGMEIS